MARDGILGTITYLYGDTEATRFVSKTKMLESITREVKNLSFLVARKTRLRNGVTSASRSDTQSMQVKTEFGAKLAPE